MDMVTVCEKAIDYSGEKFISRIVKDNKQYIVSMCDEVGNDLFIPAVSVDIDTGHISDYSPIDDEDDTSIELEIPKKYLSKKGTDIYAVIERKSLNMDYVGFLDSIYEKEDLYYEPEEVAVERLSIAVDSGE